MASDTDEPMDTECDSDSEYYTAPEDTDTDDTTYYTANEDTDSSDDATPNLSDGVSTLIQSTLWQAIQMNRWIRSVTVTVSTTLPLRTRTPMILLTTLPMRTQTPPMMRRLICLTVCRRYFNQHYGKRYRCADRPAEI
ncbi:uncharacterized protein [Branchiostoma lanceolatum]|uniref:uncharacterized protein n=1 Tax=Branchiostoma lanceolatum TaxID=7740 RepID=UPI0034560ED3